MATTKHNLVNFLVVSAAATTLFCIAIASNISPFFRGPAPYPPEWQWAYQFTNTLSRIWAPITIGIFGILGFLYFDNKKQKHKFTQLGFILYITIFTLFLQIALLFFSRAGVGVLLGRIINPEITGYFTAALSIHSVGSFLSTYQQHVAYFPMRAADHPPFAVLFFSLILFLSHFLQFLFPLVAKIYLHHGDVANIWNHLQLFQKLAALLSAVVIPLLSVSFFAPLYFFVKFYYNEKTAIRACFLYSFFPSVSLFLPLNDTFLGLFTVLGFLFFFLGQKKTNLFFYCLSGFFLSVGSFFSVSLLVPIGMLLMITLLGKVKYVKICWGGVLMGLLFIPIILFLFFHFNTFTVFIKITMLQAKRSYLPWVFYNLYDFFIFSGIPVLLCSVLLIKALVTKVKGDILATSFFIVLFVLDISGVSRAEVGRIWMPYMPILAAVVARFLTKEKKLSTSAFGIILVLQLTQLLVMQEFWVTLW